MKELRQMKKMHGVIDPYTLGFLIALIGGGTALFLEKDAGNSLDRSDVSITMEKPVESNDPYRNMTINNRS
ncbi:MAG: hypothetical protein COB30_014305 [Ectothiorhodospiraceae bacterium]|nr:hypothetical protein [Ectothiorhodospiraceae bacterium]